MKKESYYVVQFGYYSSVNHRTTWMTISRNSSLNAARKWAKNYMSRKWDGRMPRLQIVKVYREETLIERDHLRRKSNGKD